MSDAHTQKNVIPRRSFAFSLVTLSKRIVGGVTGILTGEFFLKWSPNGGGVVLRRSIYVTMILYVLALVAKSATDTGARLEFSRYELGVDVNATLPWLGALFAGVYVAFYARYSNQWSYLASVYNQFMAAKCTMQSGNDRAEKALINWQAGFVTDAFTLHLDRKPIFKGVIDVLLADPAIRAEIISNFSDKELVEFTRRHLPKDDVL